MMWTGSLRGVRKAVAVLAWALLGLPALAGQAPTPIPPGTPVTITVTPAAAAAPPVSINLLNRHGHVTPERCGCTHTGGGNIDVQQPSPDTLVITMRGVAVAAGHPCKGSSASMNFDLEQCLEITFDDPKVKKAKLTMDARVIGLLRSHCKGGAAAVSNACASLGAEGIEAITLTLPPHSVGGGENLSINDHEGPVTVPVSAGKYTLHQTFVIVADHPRGLGKASSAEFAPDPALDPLWISYKEPFHGAGKGDFGFQLTIKVVDDSAANGNGDAAAAAN